MKPTFHSLRGLVASAMLIAVNACGDHPRPVQDQVESDTAPDTCPQSGEFANFGCFRIVGRVRPADNGPLPENSTLVEVRSVGDPVAVSQQGYPDGTGHFDFLVQRGTPGPGVEDTVAVAVFVVRKYQASRHVPPVLLLGDRVTRTIRFAAVGERIPVDTIELVAPDTPPSP